MYLANTVVNPGDSVARTALALDKNMTSFNMTGTPGTGAANFTALGNFLLTLVSGDIVRFPSGTMLLDFGASAANYIQFPAGVRFMGHEKGTTFMVTNPGSGHTPLRLASNQTFQDITFSWDSTSQPTGGSSSMVWGVSKDSIVFKRCTFIGPASSGSQLYFLNGTMPVSLWGCTNVTMEQCEVKWATGTQYGLNVIGGTDHFYDRCYFHDNAADGVKIQGSVTYGRPAHIRFSDCRSDANGQTVIQGQTIGTSTITTTSTISPVNGGRYRLNFGSAGNLTLNNGTNGDIILISKVINSQDVTIKNQAGTTLFTMTGATNDRVIEKLTFTAGAWWTSGHDYYTNGEGWDIAGENLTLVNCTASGNDGAGFQIKPQQDALSYNGSNACADIRFVGCTAKSSVNGNGFAVVNNITLDWESAPQDITFSECSAISNYGNGFIFSSTARVMLGITVNHCVARSNTCGIQIQGLSRTVLVNGCRFEGNGSSGWNAKLYAAKGVRFRDCYFSGVDQTAQGLLNETAINNTANALCYGVLIDKSSGGTMADVLFDFCRWHNHLQTNGASTDIRLYTSGNTPALVADYGQTVASGVLSLSSVSNGILKINTQQTAALVNSQTTAYNAGTTYSLVDGVTGIPSVVASGGLLYRYINATPSSGNAPPNVTFWVQAGNDIISLT